MSEEEHIEEIAGRFEDVEEIVEVKKFKFAYILLSYFGISILVVFVYLFIAMFLFPKGHIDQTLMLFSAVGSLIGPPLGFVLGHYFGSRST